eukprot:m.347479 g.347479  ORF g.347479 m.347479 type:complete len:271 (-) comp32825_c0_seq1:52-864(-)
MTNTIKKIPAETLYVSEPNPAWFGNDKNPKNNERWTNDNWLKSRFHFAFAENYSGREMFGSLRVLNDDLVQPDRGFGTHPHKNAEIVTYIVDGDLTHQDTMGTKETLSRGGIQYMSAGSGVMHSEFNENKERPLRFIQMWYQPRKNNLTPRYGGFDGDKQSRHNKLAHLVSDMALSDVNTPVKIHQSVNLYAAELDAGKKVQYTLGKDEMAYFVCLEGKLDIESSPTEKQCSLKAQDAADLYGPSSISFNASDVGTHFLLIVMPKKNSLN